MTETKPKGRIVDISTVSAPCPSCGKQIVIPKNVRDMDVQIKQGGKFQITCGACAERIMSSQPVGDDTTFIETIGRTKNPKVYDKPIELTRKALTEWTDRAGVKHAAQAFSLTITTNARGCLIVKHMRGRVTTAPQVVDELEASRWCDDGGPTDEAYQALWSAPVAPKYDDALETELANFNLVPDKIEDCYWLIEDDPYNVAKHPLVGGAADLPLDLREGIGTVGGYDFCAGKKIRNRIIDGAMQQESGDWYHVIAGGREALMWQNQSVFARIGDMAPTVVHAFMLKVGDIVFADDGSAIAITALTKITGTHDWFRCTIGGNHAYILNGIVVHNADRYAVATGNWNDVNTWSASTGGAAGASFPTLSDNAVFDILSGNITVTVNVASACADFDGNGIGGVTAFTGTLAGSSALSVYGSGTFSGSMTITFTGTINWAATATGKTITCNGKTFTSNIMNFSGSGGGWTLQDDFLTSGSTGSILHTFGHLNTNGKAITAQTFQSTNAGGSARQLTMGASAVSAQIYTFDVANIVSLNFGTSVLTMTGSSGRTFSSGANTFYDLVISEALTTLDCASASFRNVTKNVAASYDTLTVKGSFTCTGTFAAAGNNTSTQRLFISSNTSTSRTITAAAVTLSNCDWYRVTGAGAATWSGTSMGNAGNCSNITFDSPISCYWVGDGTSSHAITDALWFTASGGAVAARFPLPQDTMRFDANSIPGAGRTITANATYRLGAINWTGATNSPTFSSSNNPTLYGSLTLISAMTFSMSSSWGFVGDGSYSLTMVGKTFDSVYWAMDGGTCTLADAFATTSVSHESTFSGGTLTASSSVVLGPFSFGNGAWDTRVLNMGSSTWTMAGQNGSFGYTFGASNVTGLTVNAGTSTLVLSNTSAQTVTIPGFTLNNLTVSGSGTGAVIINGASSIINGTTTVSNTGGASVNLYGAASMSHRNIVFTGFTGTWTNSSAAAGSVKGDITLAAGMTVSYAQTLTFNGLAGQTIVSAGKTFPGALTFNAAVTFTTTDALISSGTVTLTAGTIAIGSTLFKATVISTSGTGTRAFTGTGTIEATSTGTVWDASTSTNLSIGSGLTIKLSDASASAKAFAGGGATYGSLTLSGAGAGSFTISGANTTFSGTCAVTNTGGASATLYGSSGMSYATINFTGFTGTFAGSTAGTVTTAITVGAGGLTSTFSGGLTANTSVAVTSNGGTITGGMTFTAGTFTFADAPIFTGTITHTAGTLAFGANDAHIANLATTNSNTRAITGTGNIYLTGIGTVLDITTATGLTVSGAPGIIVNNSSSSAKTLKCGGKTFGNFWFTGGGSGTCDFTTGNAVFDDFKMDAGLTLRGKISDNVTITANTYHLPSSAFALSGF